MKLIVGLGNPGQKYRETRHNIGFMVLAELATRYSASTPKGKFQGELSEVFGPWRESRSPCSDNFYEPKRYQRSGGG